MKVRDYNMEFLYYTLVFALIGFIVVDAILKLLSAKKRLRHVVIYTTKIAPPEKALLKAIRAKVGECSVWWRKHSEYGKPVGRKVDYYVIDDVEEFSANYTSNWDATYYVDRKKGIKLLKI